MQLETITYDINNGWSTDNFPELDSPQTLILVFAAPEFINDTSAIEALVKLYPNSTMIGCSTSGEIFGARIQDLSLSIAIIKFKNTSIKSTISRLYDEKDSLPIGQD